MMWLLNKETKLRDQSNPEMKKEDTQGKMCGRKTRGSSDEEILTKQSKAMLIAFFHTNSIFKLTENRCSTGAHT